MKLFKMLMLAMFTASVLTSSLACNTTEGAGRDMERAGEKIQDAAD